MKSALVLFCVVSTAVGLPFNFGGFGGQASGNAQGQVTEGHSSNPYGTSSHITNTGSNARGNSINGAPNYSNGHATNFHGLGGTGFSNTGAQSIQPGLGGFVGASHGFGGFGSQASGQAQGTVTEGQSYGPQGNTHIINTVSNAAGSSHNGAPNYSNAQASNIQGPGGTSLSDTGATSIQPGFNTGYGRSFGGFGGFGGYNGGF